ALHGRRGWPVAVVRPDYALHRLDGGVLQVRGQRTRAGDGAVYGTAFVAELRPTTRQVLTHVLDPHAAVLRRRRLTGGQSVEEFEAAGTADQLQARQAAVAAVGTLLGRTHEEAGGGAEVVGVRSDTPGVRVGDVVVAVGSIAVGTAGACAAALASTDAATLTIIRPGDVRSDGVVETRLTRHDDRRWGLRLVTRSPRLTLPFDVAWHLPATVAGPSLALAMALSLAEVLSSTSVTGGATIAATGCLGLDGTVYPVGGVALKARAVAACPEVSRFLVPAGGPAGDSEVTAARRLLGSRVEVLPVSSLEHAVRVLSKVKEPRNDHGGGVRSLPSDMRAASTGGGDSRWWRGGSP
ncbi:MAG: S16 family serine protease, partial [Nocardioidaceae bacterium]